MSRNRDETRLPLVQKFTLYKRRWVILAVFSLIIFTNEALWINLSSITSIVKVYYKVDSNSVNWLSMIFFLLFIFVVAALQILNRFGLKFTIVIGAVLNGLGSCLRCIGANRDGFVLVFLGNTLAAFAECFLLFIPPRLAAVWFGENERATASSIGLLMNMFGVAGGFLMGVMVPNSRDMDYTVRKGMANQMIMQAVICTVLVLFSVLFVKDAPPTPPSKSQALLLQLQDRDRMQKVLKGEVIWNRGSDHLQSNGDVKSNSEEDERSPLINHSGKGRPKSRLAHSEIDAKVKDQRAEDESSFLLEKPKPKESKSKRKTEAVSKNASRVKATKTSQVNGHIKSTVVNKERKNTNEECVRMDIYLLTNKEFRVKFSKRDDTYANGSISHTGMVESKITQHEGEISIEEGALERKITYDKIPNLRESLWILVKDRSFHLLCQAYSIYYGLNCAYNTILNEMVISKYPGKEKQIGYLGFISNFAGVLAMFFSGVWLDRTKLYKKLSLWTFGICSLTMLIFTLLLTYDNHFIVMFIIFCVFSTFSYPFISVGLEYAAEISYPISESTTSCVILFFGNLYSVLFTQILWRATKTEGADVAGYIMFLFFLLSLVFIFLITAPLKRSEAEKPISTSTVYSAI